RKEIVRTIHEKGKDVTAYYIMRKDIPTVKITEKLHVVQKIMQSYATHALPVKKNGEIVGIVTLDDINRVYVMMNED
ncbi:MAG: CBS domain-containing protein, partial [Candidatus Omnitrophica bacterium]|nr:CBS domain-containing protein [Candidatus Omnitrophota bacterium]